MRRLFELTVIAATAGLLVATSQARAPCPVETLSVRADSTCGMSANIVLSSTTSCSLTATGAEFGGLPTSGYVNQGVADAGIGSGFTLSGGNSDGGGQRVCDFAAPNADGGFTFRCQPSCFITTDDGGLEGCPDSCEGTLTPQ